MILLLVGLLLFGRVTVTWTSFGTRSSNLCRKGLRFQSAPTGPEFSDQMIIAG
jgi:hypothetical protein